MQASISCLKRSKTTIKCCTIKILSLKHGLKRHPLTKLLIIQKQVTPPFKHKHACNHISNFHIPQSINSFSQLNPTRFENHTSYSQDENVKKKKTTTIHKYISHLPPNKEKKHTRMIIIHNLEHLQRYNQGGVA